MVIAKKTGVQNGWLAWVPVINLWVMCRAGKRPGWWVLLLLVPFINLVFIVLVWTGIAAARGKPGWIGVLILVPVLGLLVPLYLALGPGVPVAVQRPRRKASQEPTEPSRVKPGVCPSCGAQVGSEDAFCGDCGQDLSAIGIEPEEQASKGNHKIGKGALAAAALLVAALGTWWLIGILSGPSDVDRKPVKLPARMAGTLSEFPVDTDPTATTRPVSVVTQALGRGQPSGEVELPENWLPPGMNPHSLPSEADAMTSAVYRSDDDGPSVNVHVLNTPDPTANGRTIANRVQQATSGDLTQVRVESPQGAVYSGYKIQFPQGITFVLGKQNGTALIIIYAPNSGAIGIATRLAANVGNGRGLIDYPGLTRALWILPPEAPGDLELVAMNTVTPRDLGWSAGGPSEAAISSVDSSIRDFLSQLAWLMPQRITTAVYRDPSRREWNVLAATYPTNTRAAAVWLAMRGMLGFGGWHSVGTPSGTALVGVSDQGRVIAQRQGPNIVMAKGPDDADQGALANLAGSLQTGARPAEPETITFNEWTKQDAYQPEIPKKRGFSDLAEPSAAGSGSMSQETTAGPETRDAGAGTVETGALPGATSSGGGTIPYEYGELFISGVFQTNCQSGVENITFELMVGTDGSTSGDLLSQVWFYAPLRGSLTPSGALNVRGDLLHGGSVQIAGKVRYEGLSSAFLKGNGQFRLDGRGPQGHVQCTGGWIAD
jgi:hypothetical protein